MIISLTLHQHLVDIDCGINIWENVSNKYSSAKLIKGCPYNSINIEINENIFKDLINEFKHLLIIKEIK